MSNEGTARPVRGRAVRLEGGRIVRAIADLETMGVELAFFTPLEHGDIKDGKPVPRAVAGRKHGRLITAFRLSHEAAEALHEALSRALGYE